MSAEFGNHVTGPDDGLHAIELIAGFARGKAAYFALFDDPSAEQVRDIGRYLSERRYIESGTRHHARTCNEQKDGGLPLKAAGQPCRALRSPSRTAASYLRRTGGDAVSWSGRPTRSSRVEESRPKIGDFGGPRVRTDPVAPPPHA